DLLRRGREATQNACDTLLLQGPLRPSLISTSATRFTPLQAIARLPSRVTDTLRTTPPPEGIAHVWNFSVFGSKRTTVFGFTADSLYQMTSWIDVMPYGCDFGPPGDGHSFTVPVLGSSRPRYPRA